MCNSNRHYTASTLAQKISTRLISWDRAKQAAIALTACIFGALNAEGAKNPPNAGFEASAAYAYTRRAVSFGERPAGSEANNRLREWILSELKPLGAQLITDAFTGNTPKGPVSMMNVIAKFPGHSGKAIAITGHFDTAPLSGVQFVGANDGGSSTGFLLEFARVVSKMMHADDIYVVFFDGEEAFVNWTDTDSRYGSRHLSEKWLADGTLRRLRALINVDMIGDKELDLANDSNSSPELRRNMEGIAAKLGDDRYFAKSAGAIDDDHKPFADLGVNVIDVIDLDYGPNNSYWHTGKDTMDKLSIKSFQTVGDLVLGLVQQLENRT